MKNVNKLTNKEIRFYKKYVEGGIISVEEYNDIKGLSKYIHNYIRRQQLFMKYN